MCVVYFNWVKCHFCPDPEYFILLTPQRQYESIAFSPCQHTKLAADTQLSLSDVGQLVSHGHFTFYSTTFLIFLITTKSFFLNTMPHSHLPPDLLSRY